MSILFLFLNPTSDPHPHRALQLVITSQASAAGKFFLSIDVAAPGERTSAAANARVEGVCDQLLQRLNEWRLPATWAVDEPAHWSFAKRLQASSVEHEIAILAGSDWIGSAAGRNLFAQELGRRVLAGRSAGLSISTVAPYESTIDDHLDLLVQHEISAVRGIVDLDARASRPAQPHPLHYGLWEMPGSLALPRFSRWWPGGGGAWKARRAIHRAAVQGECFHLVLDVAALAQAGSPGLGVVDRVLRAVASGQEAGNVLAMTLAQAARHLTPARSYATSRSILRAAG